MSDTEIPQVIPYNPNPKVRTILWGTLFAVSAVGLISVMIPPLVRHESPLSNLVIYLSWCLPILIVTLGCSMDPTRNPCGHSTKYVMTRFRTWMLAGFTYAMSYFARYNLNMANKDSVCERFGVTTESFSVIITVGFWSYGIFVIFNGFIVDKIGAKKSVIMGAIGSGIMNVVIGIFVWLAEGHVRGNAFIIWMCILYGINNYAQTMSTCAIVKVGAQWYRKEERGFFSGVFGIVISFGFFLAFKICGYIYQYMALPWLFLLPGAIELGFGLTDILLLYDTPLDAFTEEEIVPLTRGNEQVLASVTQKPSFMDVIRPLLRQPVFIAFCFVEICIGWIRDNWTTWYPKYFSDWLQLSDSSPEANLGSTALTVGGMFGSLFSGIVSDKVFKGRRPPVILMNATCITVFLFLTLVDIESLSGSGYSFAALVGCNSIFFNGLHGLVSAALAVDLAGSSSTGTAVGLLDGIQKMASGLTGILSSKIMAAFPHLNGWSAWAISMMPAALAIIAVFGVYDVLDVRRRQKVADYETLEDEEPVEENEEKV